jgi:Transcription factor WhiB
VLRSLQEPGVSQRVRPLGPTGNPRPQATAHAAPNCSTPSNSNAAPADPAWSRRCSHDHRRISRRGWAESEALTRALINLAARGLRTHCSDATLSELWLSDHPGERREATRLCQGCPVFAPCGAAADERDERHGVWGGVDRTVTPGRAKSKRDRLASAHRRVCGEAKMIMVRDFPTIPASSFLACYFGIVQGNSPGWSRARESPLHVEFGSSGGPHHGERSSHQYSPVNMPMKRMKPTSKRTKATIPAVSQL